MEQNHRMEKPWQQYHSNNNPSSTITAIILVLSLLIDANSTWKNLVPQYDHSANVYCCDHLLA